MTSIKTFPNIHNYRQHNLLTNKLFLCQCARCADPTELSSNASAIKCTNCIKRGGDGLLFPVAGNTDIWKCSDCASKFNSLTVERLLFNINVGLFSSKIVLNPYCYRIKLRNWWKVQKLQFQN